jgi:hypothetical protein
VVAREGPHCSFPCLTATREVAMGTRVADKLGSPLDILSPYIKFGNNITTISAIGTNRGYTKCWVVCPMVILDPY